MLSKSDIKYLRSLHLLKYRNREKRFIVEGNINVRDFLQGPFGIERLYATEKWLKNYHRIIQKDVRVVQVKHQQMEKISALKNASDVLAVVEMPEYNLPILSLQKGYILAVDAIRNPGNLGTIIRTADWFGIENIVCSLDTVDAYNPKVVQATMGSLARVKVHYTDLNKFFAQRPKEFKVYGALMQGVDIRRVEKSGKGILLIGNEAHGIRGTLLEEIDVRMRIPASKKNGAESLNAAIATAIVCYSFVMLK